MKKHEEESMTSLNSRLAAIAACLFCFGCGPVFGQAYPTKAVRILTGEAGGGIDLMSRLIAQGISGPLGQPVIVENRSAIIANEITYKAPPDGYLLLLNSSSLWLGPMFIKAPYDPVRDFAPIISATRAPLVLVVHPSLPVKSVKDLIALAKARPGELNYATGSTGAPTHLSAEILRSMAHVNMVRVPYKGTGPAINALASGEVQWMLSTPGGATGLVKAGRLRMLAVSSGQRSALFPDLPTIAEAVPGYESVSLAGLFAPAKTPDAVIRRLNQEIAQVLNRADVKEKLLSIGVEALSGTPEEWGALIKAEIDQVAKAVKPDPLAK
jgi:tripartite-type tricarboxylate transporter receptor subunit TctC